MKFEFVNAARIEATCPLYDKPIDAEYIDARGCGNTIRIVDKTIDLLFKGYSVRVQDHIAMFPERYTRSTIDKQNERTLELVLNRLASEHRGCNIYISRKDCLVCIANLPSGYTPYV